MSPHGYVTTRNVTPPLPEAVMRQYPELAEALDLRVLLKATPRGARRSASVSTPSTTPSTPRSTRSATGTPRSTRSVATLPSRLSSDSEEGIISFLDRLITERNAKGLRNPYTDGVLPHDRASSPSQGSSVWTDTDDGESSNCSMGEDVCGSFFPVSKASPHRSTRSIFYPIIDLVAEDNFTLCRPFTKIISLDVYMVRLIYLHDY